MALGGRNCPFCRCYNALDEKTCVRCLKWLPPPNLTWALREPLLTEHWATKLLAGVSIVVFALQLAVAGVKDVGLITGMPPAVIVRFGGIAGGIEWIEPWRFLSACFVHMGVLHVAMNVMAFAELGRVAEREINGSRLVLAYVITGIVGFVVSSFWYGAHVVTAGASGAVFGIDGVLIGGMLAKRDRRWVDMLVRTVVHSFLFYAMLRTNQAAHLGGLAAGLVLGLLFGKESRPWRIERPVRVVTAASVVAIVASIGLSLRSPLWKGFAALDAMREQTGP
jgi:rhomboid protease GluP